MWVCVHSLFAPGCICVCACVCVGQCVQWVGQVRLACQRLEHLWHSCHPRSPSSAPKQGNWEGGTSSQGGPQAVSVHYCYRDGTWPAGGQTFTPHLLWSSAAPLCVCVSWWVCKPENKKGGKIKGPCLSSQSQTCMFYIWPMEFVALADFCLE